ncbi:hypothetical protein D3C80_1812090 [compost metagenome]
MARIAIASPFSISAFSAEITPACSSMLSRNLLADKMVVNAVSQILVKVALGVFSA